MTRLERTIRQVSDLRDFYLKLEKQRKRAVHTDLDHLAGTWSAAEARAFPRATRVFRKLETTNVTTHLKRNGSRTRAGAGGRARRAGA